tara:strand:- start:123 stop:344 length:222 start_codon:yes stop_codon:yes gene_type:complete
MEHVLILYVNQFDVPKIENILIEHKVSFFFKTPNESSIMAGWVTPGTSFNEKSLFVEKSKLDLVKKLLSDFTN